MDVLITRSVGLRGTAILAREYRSELLSRYPERLVDTAASFDKDMDKHNDTSVISDIFTNMNDVYGIAYAKEYTEFGVYEALFQASKELKCGMRIRIKDIPIRQETVEVSEFTEVNPYELYSGLSMVIVAENARALKEYLLKEFNIPSSIVAYTTPDNDKIISNDEEEGFLPHIRKDELKNKLGRKLYYERTDSVNLREEQQDRD